MNGNDKSYDYFKSCLSDYSFHWYVYSDDIKKKSKSHRYSMISEHVVRLMTNEKMVHDWKKEAFENFTESRKKVAQQIESDDVRDVDYLNNYQNRGKINVFNLFYFECEDMAYFIDNTYVKYNLYYYNKLKDTYYGIYVTDNERTSVDECDMMSITNSLGPTFCLEIKQLWLDVSRNPYQHLYVAWPGYILPYPDGYEKICVDMFLPYSDDCLEVSPFVLVANAFHLMNNTTLANKVFNARCDYYNTLLDERRNVDDVMKHSSVMYMTKNKKQSNEKFDRPFQMLTRLCSCKGIKCLSVNHRLDLISQHEIMNIDEMIVFYLKAAGYYLCVMKHYIMSSNMKQPVVFSKEVLDHFSYGIYIGIKQGIYITSRQGNKDFIKKFKDNYDHSVFKVG
jgi:hypothetical protein